jgi:hypothetical protein
MACYTISNCVLEHLNEGRKYTADLLLTFTQENDHKIAVDESEKIIEIYTTTAEKISDNDIKIGIINWLSLMKLKPPKWEYIEIENTSNDIFLEVCCNTIDKKMIVSSENKCKWKNGISTDKLYSHRGISIRILNKDEAIIELKPKPIVIQQINTNTNTNTNK